MNVTVPVPEIIGKFENRLLRDLAAKIDEWSRCRQKLTGWEDEHLRGENPPAERLAEHERMLDRLMFFGQIFALVTSDPDFPDPEMAEMVHANQFILREKLHMFHHPMDRGQAEQILREVFPEP